MDQSILITRAFGVLGKPIVAAALNAGFTVRQGVRDPGKASPLAEAVSLNYAGPATPAPASRICPNRPSHISRLSASVVRQGLAAGVTGDVEAITGRKPMTFAEFALAKAGAWRTPVPAVAE